MLPLTPTKLGRYEILDEIGKGAMGVVYLARDPLIGRLVALKTFRMGFSVRDQEADQFRARFIREAQSAGILSHPNIVTIHDVVEAAGDGLSFIAMEYVRGTNLKMVMQADPSLPLARVSDIISQVAEALDYAHSQRVIHRDVKPANIIITEDGRVKITDFGIARLDTSNLTQEGQLLGTPNYMAPEQVQGKEVDHRADIFALGVVLYEMLTRHKPFQGENLTVVSHRIVYDQFTPLREYARNVPPGVEKIISRALEKDPNRRYQKAREMADELKTLAAESLNGDELNETQSLSSTMVIPAGSALPGASTTSSPSTVGPAAGAGSAGSVGSGAAAPVRKPLWGRLFGGGKAAPAAPPLATVPAAAPDLLSGTGTGSRPPAPAVPVAVPPLAPPAMAPANDDGSVAPALSATGSSVSIPPPPPLPMPAPPRAVPPAASRSGKVGRQLIGAAIAALLLGFIIFWGIARTRDSRQEAAPPVVAATPQQSPAAVVDPALLFAQGNALMRKGRFAEAAAVYGLAEPHAQNHPDIPWLRQEAVRMQAELERMVGEEKEIENQLAEAQAAWRTRSYLEAIAAANLVLEARPWEKEASDIVRRARIEIDRQRGSTQMADGGELSPQHTGSEEDSATETPRETETSPAAPETGRVQMSLRIDAPAAEGAVRVYLGSTKIWDQPFDVGEGLLKRRRSRDFSKGYEVPAGENKLLVYYSPKDLEVTGTQQPVTVNVPGGGVRRVDIRITQSGRLYAVGEQS